MRHERSDNPNLRSLITETAPAIVVLVVAGALGLQLLIREWIVDQNSHENSANEFPIPTQSSPVNSFPNSFNSDIQLTPTLQPNP